MAWDIVSSIANSLQSGIQTAITSGVSSVFTLIYNLIIGTVLGIKDFVVALFSDITRTLKVILYALIFVMCYAASNMLMKSPGQVLGILVGVIAVGKGLSAVM